jgi:hypothetical protein
MKADYQIIKTKTEWTIIFKDHPDKTIVWKSPTLWNCDFSDPPPFIVSKIKFQLRKSFSKKFLQALGRGSLK